MDARFVLGGCADAIYLRRVKGNLDRGSVSGAQAVLEEWGRRVVLESCHRDVCTHSWGEQPFGLKFVNEKGWRLRLLGLGGEWLIVGAIWYPL